MKKISQREARATRKELAALKQRQERQLSRWASSFPGGANIATEDMTPNNLAKLETAMLLGYAVVCRLNGGNVLYYAVKP